MKGSSYEDQFRPLSRRIRRVGRAVCWAVKGAARGPRCILVEVRWRLGDEVMAIPIYQALRERHGDCRLTVWCNYPDLLEGNPYVDAVNDAAVRPDRYILLRGVSRHVHRLEDYARTARVPMPETRPRLYFEDWATPLLTGVRMEGRSLVAVSSGASWPTKRWPVSRWQSVCRALQEEGCTVVQLGSGDDDVLGIGTSLVNRTTVREAACMLRASDLLICCDSGLMHLALAAGIRVLALFGPTDPDILVRNEPPLAVIANDRDCCGCWNRQQGPITEGVCPRDIVGCLDPITPEMVLKRALELLRHGA